MSSRYDPYSAPSGNSWLPRSEVYPGIPLHGVDAYHPASYRSGTLLAPPPPARASASTSSDDTSFARELLQLYTKDPAAFDAYARNPDVRRSLNLQSEPSLSAVMRTRDEVYLKTPREYVMEQRLQQRYTILFKAMSACFTREKFVLRYVMKPKQHGNLCVILMWKYFFSTSSVVMIDVVFNYQQSKLNLLFEAAIYLLQYTVNQKTLQNCFCQNFVKFPPILIILDRKMAKRLKLCEMHSFPNSPNRTTAPC